MALERYKPVGLIPAPAPPKELYFEPKEITFLPTGCTLFDCVIGGGWPLGRIVNIVGDKSVGKTLLAEEAMANFLRNFPDGKVFYRETEAAFDASYARALGLDTSRIDFGPNGPDSRWETIEDIIEDLKAQLNNFDSLIVQRAKQLREKTKKLSTSEAEGQALASAPPGLYIIDSLDAVSSSAELKRDIREGSYNLEKQKLLGELLRTEARRLRRARMGLMFVSQIRERIGATVHGKKYVRTGGKALDFYASVVIYLSNLGKVYQTIKKIKRPTAVHIKAMCEKNKITMPFRECEFDIRFGYGIDDEWASLDWLKSVDKLEAAGFMGIPSSLDKVDSAQLRESVIHIWQEIERGFAPAKGKYA